MAKNENIFSEAIKNLADPRDTWKYRYHSSLTAISKLAVV